MTENRRDVELRIKATDQSAAVLKGTAGNIDKVTKSLSQQEKAALSAAEASAASYNKISKDLAEAQKKAADAQKAYNDFANSVAGAGEPSRKQVREFEALGRAAERADKDVARLTANLGKAEDSFNRNMSKFEQAGADRSARGQAETGSLKLAAAIEQAEESQRRIAELNAFRVVGDDALSAVRDFDAFTASSGRAGTAASSLSTDLLGIIDPARTARQSLEGLEEETARVTAVVGDADKPIRNYQDAINDLGRIQAEILKQGAAIDAYREQAAAVGQATEAYEAARADVIRYAEAIRQAEAPNEQLAAKLNQAKAALAASSRELDQQRAKLAQVKKPLDAAKISVDKLTDAEMRLRTASEVTSVSVAKLDRAMAGQNTKAGRFLGLKPYEIQNLGFQINDVFTQLASGASVTQTLAQQGGQILQIFPGLFARLVSFLPHLTALVLVLGTFAAVIKRISDQGSAVREFTGLLSLNADGARYNAQALAETAKSLDLYGASLDEAKSAQKAFIAEGVRQEDLEAFGAAAKNLADVMGIDIPEAAGKTAVAFTKGFDAVRALDEETNFLTASELEHIKAMFDSGQAADARRFAFERFSEVVQEAADKSRSEWSESTRALTNVWDRFIESIANKEVIVNTINELNGLISLAQKALDLLRDIGPAADQAQKKRKEGPGAVGWAVDRLLPGDLGTLGSRWLRGRRGPDPVPPRRTIAPGAGDDGPTEAQIKKRNELAEEYEDEQRKALLSAKKLTDAERLRAAAEKARMEAADAGLTNEQIKELEVLAVKTEQVKIDKEREKTAKKSATAARRDANKRASLEANLLNQRRQMETQIARRQETDLDARLAAIDTRYARIFDTLEKFEKAGGTSVDGASLPEYRKQVEAGKEILKQQETLAYYEDALQKLQDSREATLARIADQYAAGAISAAEAYRLAQETQRTTAPEIAKMADDALRFAETMAGADPSPEMRAFIEEMKQLRDNAARPRATNAPDSEAGRGLMAAEERELNAIIAERNELVASYLHLAELGEITHAEAQEKTRQAYERAAPLIEQQVVKFRELLDALKEAGAITGPVYDAWIAKLQAVGAEAQYVDENFLKIKESMQNSVAQGITKAFNDVSAAIANAINGTGTWEEAVASLGRAALDFIASFLRGLGEVLLQIAILQAIQNLPFFDSLTSGIMDFTGLTLGATALGAASTKLDVTATGLAAASSPWFAVSVQLQAAAMELTAAATMMIAANATAAVAHTGQVIGRGTGLSRSVPASLLAGAPRYHAGTPGVGLGVNERAAILKVGEEVLTEDNPRHIKNAGKRGSGMTMQKFRQVLLLDPKEISQAMAGSDGEDVFLTHLKANITTVRQLLGS